MKCNKKSILYFLINSCSSHSKEISRVLLSCLSKLLDCITSRIPRPAITNLTKANTVKKAKIPIKTGWRMGITTSPIVILNFTKGFNSRSSWGNKEIYWTLYQIHKHKTYKLIPKSRNHSFTEFHNVCSKSGKLWHWNWRHISDVSV